MGADLHHPARVEDHDAVGALRGAQAMGHHQHRRCGATQLGEHLDFLGRVDVGEDIVEHQERRPAGQRPGHCHPLTLAAGEREAALADYGVEARANPVTSASMPAATARRARPAA